jgi:acyl carrier protein
MAEMEETIREVLALQGRLPVDISAVEVSADLYQAGLTSHASVNVMLALEDAFDVEFPDSMLRKSTFESIASIAEALTELGVSAPAI